MLSGTNLFLRLPRTTTSGRSLVYQFAQHLVDRYGADEVAQWYFEVWNEPNIDFWTGQAEGGDLFRTVRSCGARHQTSDSGLRVGGPATAQAAWVDDMIAHSEK